jgi:hypothetical protein
MDQNILSMLTSYRDGHVSREQLLKWLDANNDKLSAQLARGPLLELRRGDDYTAMTALSRILPSCSVRSICLPSKKFVSWGEYEQCVARIDNAEVEGMFARINPPVWTLPHLTIQALSRSIIVKPVSRRTG